MASAASRPARRPRRRPGAERSSQPGSPRARSPPARPGQRGPWPGASALRPGAAGRAAAPNGSPSGRSRTARRARAADDLEEAEAVDRGPLERLGQDRIDRRGGGLAAARPDSRQVDADRSADAETPDRAAAARAAGEARARPAARCRRRRSGSSPASARSAARRRESDLAARGLVEQVRPAGGLERSALRGGEGVQRADPLGEARSAAAAVARASGALPRLGAGERLARDLDAERRALGQARGRALRGADIPPRRHRDRHARPGSTAGPRGRSRRDQGSGRCAPRRSRRPRPGRAVFADPALDQPLRQADSPRA